MFQPNLHCLQSFSTQIVKTADWIAAIVDIRAVLEYGHGYLALILAWIINHTENDKQVPMANIHPSTRLPFDAAAWRPLGVISFIRLTCFDQMWITAPLQNVSNIAPVIPINVPTTFAFPATVDIPISSSLNSPHWNFLIIKLFQIFITKNILRELQLEFQVKKNK